MVFLELFLLYTVSSVNYHYFLDEMLNGTKRNYDVCFLCKALNYILVQ